ncbi:hypothetical protein L6164_018141 [Bauhinia variegata]|uniref:Uncharacterized protein n=1 Tax=Bauhinia variegata TaxID=167791 RepID=A0ACB9NA39_BAUVA|nr:hypothetical protein L6164_018141 [Bauhinia variegata]
MGRQPCCDKSQVKRGPWSSSEDLKLVTFIQRYGHDNWRALPKQAGLQRCGKSCRLRWINYLRPDVKRGNFTEEEEDTIMRLHGTFGNKWAKIASHLPGRTDNEIKNVWHTCLKKKLLPKTTSGSSAEESNQESTITSPTASSSSVSNGTPNTANSISASESTEQEGQTAIKPQSPMQVEPEKPVSMGIDVGITEAMKESSTSILAQNPLNSSNPSSELNVYRPEEPSLLDYMGPYDVNNTLAEVERPEGELHIPSQLADDDFWSFMDSIESFKSNNYSIESSNLGGDHSAEGADNNNWADFLLTELGLEGAKEQNQGHFLPKEELAQPAMDSKPVQFETTAKPEGDGNMFFIPTSPFWSWPHNSGFFLGEE